MNKYYEKINLPKIPLELLDPIDKIMTFKDEFDSQGLFDDTNFNQTYAIYTAPQKLHDYIQTLFDFPVKVNYQVIHKKLPKHKDIGIVGKKYNYLIDTGGDVYTRWYDDNDTVLFEIKSKPFEWHALQIDIEHDITTPSHTRLSVVVIHAESP